MFLVERRKAKKKQIVQRKLFPSRVLPGTNAEMRQPWIFPYPIHSLSIFLKNSLIC